MTHTKQVVRTNKEELQFHQLIDDAFVIITLYFIHAIQLIMHKRFDQKLKRNEYGPNPNEKESDSEKEGEIHTSVNHKAYARRALIENKLDNQRRIH